MEEFPDDIDQLKALIDAGEKRAYLHLAFVYEKQNDIENANKYYKAGAEAGEKDAQFFYALRHENGINTEIDLEIANKYYKLSADQGNTDAAFRYSLNLSEGNGIDVNTTEATRYLKIAQGVEQPSTDSNDSQLNPTDIKSLTKKALEDKDPEAMLLCGFYYDDQNNKLAHNPQKAHEFFKMSADAGNDKAQFTYGVILLYGVDIEKEDPEAGLEYIKLAAQNGNMEAKQFIDQVQKSQNKGNHHLNGFEGLPEDDVAELERIVKEENNSFAMLRLGLLYDSMEKFEEANRMIKMSSENGNPNAQFLYGLRKEFGINTDIDLTEANSYYRKSAVQGNEDASFRLGLNLLNGNGVDKNEKEANAFLKISAELGHKDAMIYLAANLKDGIGTDPDPELADVYYRRAMGLKPKSSDE